MELFALFILVAFISFAVGYVTAYIIDLVRTTSPSKAFKKVGEELSRPDVSAVFERRIDR